MSEHCGCAAEIDHECVYIYAEDCLFPALQRKYEALLIRDVGFPATRYAILSDYAERFGYNPVMSNQTAEGVVMDSLDAAIEAIRRLRESLDEAWDGMLFSRKDKPTIQRASRAKAILKETKQYEVK